MDYTIEIQHNIKSETRFNFIDSNAKLYQDGARMYSKYDIAFN